MRKPSKWLFELPTFMCCVPWLHSSTLLMPFPRFGIDIVVTNRKMHRSTMTYLGVGENSVIFPQIGKDLMPIEGCTMITIENCFLHRIVYTATSLRTFHRATRYELPLHADCLKASRDGHEDVLLLAEDVTRELHRSRPCTSLCSIMAMDSGASKW